jgi:hypothetical protein
LPAFAVVRVIDCDHSGSGGILKEKFGVEWGLNGVAPRHARAGVSTFQRHAAGVAAIAVLISAAATGLCAAIILCWQLVTFLKTGKWMTIAVADVLELAHISVPRSYIVSSATPREPRWFDAQSIIDWWLDAPAILPLLIAGALLALLYMWLAAIREQPAAG